jgi:hypothetical protein
MKLAPKVRYDEWMGEVALCLAVVVLWTWGINALFDVSHVAVMAILFLASLCGFPLAVISIGRHYRRCKELGVSPWA